MDAYFKQEIQNIDQYAISIYPSGMKGEYKPENIKLKELKFLLGKIPRIDQLLRFP